MKRVEAIISTERMERSVIIEEDDGIVVALLREGRAETRFFFDSWADALNVLAQDLDSDPPE